MKKIKLSEKNSKVSNRRKNSNERNSISNYNGIKDIRSLVYRSLELDTTSAFNESLKYSGINVSYIPEQRTETTEKPMEPSISGNNWNSSTSSTVPQIFNQSNSNCTLQHTDCTLFDIQKINSMPEDASDVFLPKKSSSFNVSKVSTSYSEENSKNSSFFDIDMSDAFLPMKSNNFNVSRVSNLDSEENSKNSSFSVIDMSDVFMPIKSNSLNVSNVSNSDSDENHKNSSFFVIGGSEEARASTVLSTEKTFLSESPKSVEINRKKYQCPHCVKSFRFPSKLKRHINTHRIKQNNSDVDENETSLIEKGIDSETTDFHNVLHKKKEEQCPNCSKSFKHSSKLLRHIKTHVGLKSYKCHLCSKAFLEKFNLNAHMKIHETNQPYICSICEKAFNIKSNLNRHLKSHMREKQFTCNICGKACSSEKKLAIHYQTHQEIQPECPECGKEFKKKSNLKRHVKIHSNERKHPCNLCDYKAGRASHLKIHIRRNHTK